MTAEPSPPSTLSLATTLDRVALAMGDLGKMIAEVETCILDEIKLGGADKKVPPTVQQLDHVLQMIDELAQLIRRLAQSQETETAKTNLEIILPIGLERLRNLIAFGASEDEEGPPRIATHQILLF